MYLIIDYSFKKMVFNCSSPYVFGVLFVTAGMGEFILTTCAALTTAAFSPALLFPAMIACLAIPYH